MIETHYAEGRSIRVVLVDDHVLVREGLREILSVEPDLEVVGEAADSEQALAEIGLAKPDVALLDVEIPGIGATDTVRAIRRISPDTRVLVLSMYDGPQLLRRLLSVGICGYLLKSVDRHELVAAIRSVYYAPQRVVLSVSRESLAQAQGASDAVLSAREIEVLGLVSQALSNGQVASRLHITEATVKRHLRNVFAKLGAVSRIDAVNKAIAGSLIESPHDQLEPSQGSSRSHRVL